MGPGTVLRLLSTGFTTGSQAQLTLRHGQEDKLDPRCGPYNSLSDNSLQEMINSGHAVATWSTLGDVWDQAGQVLIATLLRQIVQCTCRTIPPSLRIGGPSIK